MKQGKKQLNRKWVNFTVNKWNNSYTMHKIVYIIRSINLIIKLNKYDIIFWFNGKKIFVHVDKAKKMK